MRRGHGRLTYSESRDGHKGLRDMTDRIFALAARAFVIAVLSLGLYALAAFTSQPWLALVATVPFALAFAVSLAAILYGIYVVLRRTSRAEVPGRNSGAGDQT